MIKRDIPCKFCGKDTYTGKCKSCNNKKRIITDETRKKISISHIGMKASNETRQKLSDLRKGEKCCWYGRKHTEETKLKIRESSLGKIVSEETRKKISEANTGKVSRNKGKIVSEETRKKISEANKGKKSWNKDLNKLIDQRIKNQSESRKGIIFSEEHKKNISLSKKAMFSERPELREMIKKRRMNQIFPLKDSKPEKRIQKFLKELGVDFFTHQYIKDIEHGYQCDIFVPAMDLVIECDGDYWHKYPVGNDIDHIRTSELIAKGFKVLRLWEHEIKIMSREDLKEKINKVV